MQSNISLEQSAKQLAGDMAKKGIGLENVFLYLARLTHQCKHAVPWQAASGVLFTV